ncbi:MAG: TatD family hydrolase [Candidatus Krumholzibacteriia bacterium]
MIDSHVHLNHPEFEDDFDAVVQRALDAGVTRMVNIGFDVDSSRETAALVEKYPFLDGAVGVHPHDAKTYNAEAEKGLADLLGRPGILAVGEIGLDYYRDLTPRDRQRDVFRRQIGLAKRMNKPIIIHCRDAFDDVVSVLREEGPPWRGIFHAFTGDAEMAGTVLDMGFHIGVGGVVTFRNSGLSQVVAGLPADAIVLETDCPYLTPAPFRGKRNEPGYLTYVVKKISEATNRSVDAIMEKTTQNFASAMGLAS